MKHFLILAVLLVTATSFAQIVTIPDAAFKQRLLNNSNINTNGDGEIQVSEAEAFDGNLNLGTNPNIIINDITGIEAFINLIGIGGQNQQFTFADFSNNNSLERIHISISALTSFVLPTDTSNLQSIEIFGTNIIDMSFLSDCQNLQSLNIASNDVSVINLANNLQLESLSIPGTDISELNINNITNLKSLNIQNTLLTEIDLSNVNLESLTIGNSSSPSLINTFDLSLQTNLEFLRILEIIESNIDLSNNVNLIDLDLNGFNHPSIDISSNTQLKDIDIAGGSIDIIDLNSNVLLENIRLENSLITEIDLSQQVNLKDIYFSNTNIQTIDITNNINLESFRVYYTDIQTIDLSQNINLNIVELQNTLLESVDVSEVIGLVELDLRRSPISNIVLPSNNVLQSFILWNTLVEELNFNDFNQLCRFFVRYNNVLSKLNLKNGNTANLASGNTCSSSIGDISSGLAITYNPNLYFVCVDDANFAATNFTAVSPQITFTEDCTLNSTDINQLTGDITYDLNNNGCASGNFALENIIVSSSDGTNTFATTSGSDGAYALNLGENTYTTGVVGLPAYFDASPASVVDTFVGYNNMEQQDFCVQANTTANDLNISINPQYSPRPGEEGVYNVIYQNAGTTQLNGSVTLTYNPDKVAFTSSTPVATSQTSNTITWDLGAVQPFTTGSIVVRLDVFSQPINIEGDPLELTAAIEPVAGDVTPDDNVFGLVDTVRLPETMDNFTVIQGEEELVADADNFLNYVVPIENNTTDVAQNVVIQTLFDSDLDLSTLQIIDSSHPVEYFSVNDEAYFRMNNIGLPAGGSPLGNNRAYIMYRIKPRAGIVDGDVVSASINLSLDGILQPTNFVSTTFRDVLAVGENPIANVKIYPNPTNGMVNLVSIEQIDTVQVLSMEGKLLKNQTLKNGERAVDISSLASGIYFFKISVENHTEIFRVIKK